MFINVRYHAILIAGRKDNEQKRRSKRPLSYMKMKKLTKKANEMNLKESKRISILYRLFSAKT